MYQFHNKMRVGIPSRVTALFFVFLPCETDAVRGLCSGNGFLFSGRGEFVTKGFEEPARVYWVRWRD